MRAGPIKGFQEPSFMDSSITAVDSHQFTDTGHSRPALHSCRLPQCKGKQPCVSLLWHVRHRHGLSKVAHNGVVWLSCPVQAACVGQQLPAGLQARCHWHTACARLHYAPLTSVLSAPGSSSHPAGAARRSRGDLHTLTTDSAKLGACNLFSKWPCCS